MSDKLIERIEECISVHLEDTASLSYERLKHKNQYDLDVLRDCKQRIEELEAGKAELTLERDVLREYAGKNCIAMTDKFLAKHTPPEGENK